MREIIQTLLRSRVYDAIVFDSLCVGWALFLKELRSNAGQPILVHIAHNHERTAADGIAGKELRLFRRMVRRLETMKVAKLERQLVDGCDFSTSNTPDDQATFQAEHPGRRIDFLPPGYGGYRARARSIDEGVPRRAIVVGSFNWEPKRTSLEAFLRCAAPLFRSASVELHIVGSADDAYLDRLRSEFESVVFTGRVDNVYDHLAAARIAVVPDYLGGFKLKSLDYVFNRVPIFALAGSVPGLPLVDGTSVRLFPNHSSLARAVVDQVDEFPSLNLQQEAAYCACVELFDWERIGANLVKAIERQCADKTKSFAVSSAFRDAVATS
jgi:glycosyltransferase involved in cell wall biosynthesis